jgi:short-subunit dehydrogenase
VKSTRKVLAIVGMGPQPGMAAARRFGRERYRLGLVARNQERLSGYVATLEREGIAAACCAADVRFEVAPDVRANIHKEVTKLGEIYIHLALARGRPQHEIAGNLQH